MCLIPFVVTPVSAPYGPTKLAQETVRAWVFFPLVLSPDCRENPTSLSKHGTTSGKAAYPPFVANLERSAFVSW